MEHGEGYLGLGPKHPKMDIQMDEDGMVRVGKELVRGQPEPGRPDLRCADEFALGGGFMTLSNARSNAPGLSSTPTSLAMATTAWRSASVILGFGVGFVFVTMGRMIR